MAERVEYGRQIDCEANGCKVKHSDDGYVFEWPMRDFGPPDLSEPPIVNGHACRWVQRHIPEWRPLVGERSNADAPSFVPCRRCAGTGEYPPTDPRGDCTRCEGLGEVEAS